MALYINFVNSTYIESIHINKANNRFVNNLDMVKRLDEISHIQADGDELAYIHSMGYHTTGKRVQIFVRDAKDIIANW